MQRQNHADASFTISQAAVVKKEDMHIFLMYGLPAAWESAAEAAINPVALWLYLSVLWG